MWILRTQALSRGCPLHKESLVFRQEGKGCVGDCLSDAWDRAKQGREDNKVPFTSLVNTLRRLFRQPKIESILDITNAVCRIQGILTALHNSWNYPSLSKHRSNLYRMRYTGKQIKQNKISHDWHAFEMCSKCVSANVQPQEPGAAAERCPAAVHMEHTHDSTTPGAYVWDWAGTILRTFTSVESFMEPVPAHKVSTMIVCIYKQGSWSMD